MKTDAEAVRRDIRARNVAAKAADEVLRASQIALLAAKKSDLPLYGAARQKLDTAVLHLMQALDAYAALREDAP
jgi:NCAIR mutase (PurE)-related protein